ncbi:hypothetical protein GPECTOR_8g121 [Gonium pectorale]|uniref:CAND6/7 N-terminal domain-containing protein n=1 Tax=Gonium pectorale TaxID=33097 RepID=A0A150GSQ9_GONPE|nr:hypothetical protein GPECTOR_8g121 [Gonium pectorale]|eukprot:KXZ52728.1 hypothetical protein GPECTOR_8g121 [Gonium pectorale]
MRASLLLLLAVALGGASAKIYHSVVVKDDRPLILLTDALGFAVGGKLDITIRDISLHGSKEKVSKWENFGFFLSPVEADMALKQDLADSSKCILNDVNNLFMFKDSAVQKVITEQLDEVTFHFVVQNGGLFYLYFANCGPDTPVSFDSRIEMYNLDKYGRNEYMSVGDTSLDSVHWVKTLLAAVESRFARVAGQVRDVLERSCGLQARVAKLLAERVEMVKKGAAVSEINRKLAPSQEAICAARHELEGAISTVFGAY